MSTSSDIELIKQDMQYVKTGMQKIEARYEKHLDESIEYRRKVDELGVGSDERFKSFFKDFRDHVSADKWAFGIMITVLLAILGRVLTK